MLRKHQTEMSETINGIIAGSPVRRIFVKATPGAGKSALPIIAGKLIDYDWADKIAWVVPRSALQHQGESNFVDPFFRNLLGHRLKIRSSTNDADPCRGLDGNITTYQALGVNNRPLINDMQRRRYILILDEFHHCEEGGIWHKAIEPLIKLSKFQIFMTGTLERGDRNAIAWAPYKEIFKDHLKVAKNPDPETAWIEYNRADALAEKAILPVRFTLFDGFAKWRKEGNEYQSTLRGADDGLVADALFAALSTDYAEGLLDSAVSDWREYIHHGRPGAKLLVVTANLEHAKRATQMLKKYPGHRVKIATSHESAAAHAAIKAYKAKQVDILVTIAMANEGLDCPSISHIACLTHIRSTPWIEQMIARGVRIDRAAGPYESQCCHVFAPDDPMFREIVARIEAEQLPFAKRKKLPTEQQEIFCGGQAKAKVEGLESRITGRRILGPDILPVPPTPSETEATVLRNIERHVRDFSRLYGVGHGLINREIKERFGKGRRDMSLTELQDVQSYITAKFPLNRQSQPVKFEVMRPMGKAL